MCEPVEVEKWRFCHDITDKNGIILQTVAAELSWQGPSLLGVDKTGLAVLCQASGLKGLLLLSSKSLRINSHEEIGLKSSRNWCGALTPPL